jgi:hypothetical protein
MCESQLLRRKQSSQNASDFWVLRLKTSGGRPRRFYSSPSLTYNQNFVKWDLGISGPFWCAECARHLHYSISPLVLLLAKTVPIFEDSSIFVHPPPPLWTTVRTSSNVMSKPLWCTESTCHLHLFIAPLVAALLTKSAPIEKISSTFEPPATSALNYSQNFFQGGVQTNLMRWMRL